MNHKWKVIINETNCYLTVNKFSGKNRQNRVSTPYRIFDGFAQNRLTPKNWKMKAVWKFWQKIEIFSMLHPTGNKFKI